MERDLNFFCSLSEADLTKFEQKRTLENETSSSELQSTAYFVVQGNAQVERNDNFQTVSI